MIHQINMIIHISAGTVALLIGLIPYLTKKGGVQHRRFGRVFLYLMGVVVITALIGVMFYRSRPFLTVVTILSFYTAFGSYRALQYREQGPGKMDLLATAITLGSALVFLFMPSEGQVVWHSGVVNYLLGFIFLLCGYDLLRILKWIQLARLWLLEHIMKMTSAYIALLSAGTGTVLTGWEPYNQILPALVGSLIYVLILVNYFVTRYRS